MNDMLIRHESPGIQQFEKKWTRKSKLNISYVHKSADDTFHNNFIGSISLAPKERKIENFLRKKCQLKKHIPNNNNNFDNDKRM